MSARGERRQWQRFKAAKAAGQQGLTFEEVQEVQMKRQHLEVWTDGACLKNPGGPGGWGLIFADGREASGSEESTTSNRMELQAIIEAVCLIPTGGSVTIYSDSQLCVHYCNGKWKRKANRDLWDIYEAEAQKRTVRLQWVRGHNGDPMNERADELAERAARACRHGRKRSVGLYGHVRHGDEGSEWAEPRLSKLMGERL